MRFFLILALTIVCALAVDSPQCGVCTAAVNVVRNHFNGNYSNKTEVQEYMDGYCQYMFHVQPPAGQFCFAMVQAKFDLIYTELKENKATHQICIDCETCKA